MEQIRALQAEVDGRVRTRRPPRVLNTSLGNPQPTHNSTQNREPVAPDASRGNIGRENRSQEMDLERQNPPGSVETQHGGRNHVHRGDLYDHLNEIFKEQSQTLRNRDDDEPRDPHVGDQGTHNMNNWTNLVNPSIAPAVTIEVPIPANIAVISTIPVVTQTNPVLPEGIDQESLLRALQMIE
uniref:Uncharacterized protein n=1 Tax=Cannabis sativa TaxID=3483 RepID=A0A803Q8P6_CANSA